MQHGAGQVEDRPQRSAAPPPPAARAALGGDGRRRRRRRRRLRARAATASRTAFDRLRRGRGGRWPPPAAGVRSTRSTAGSRRSAGGSASMAQYPIRKGLTAPRRKPRSRTRRSRPSVATSSAIGSRLGRLLLVHDLHVAVAGAAELGLDEAAAAGDLAERDRLGRAAERALRPHVVPERAAERAGAEARPLRPRPADHEARRGRAAAGGADPVADRLQVLRRRAPPPAGRNAPASPRRRSACSAMASKGIASAEHVADHRGALGRRRPRRRAPSAARAAGGMSSPAAKRRSRRSISAMRLGTGHEAGAVERRHGVAPGALERRLRRHPRRGQPVLRGVLRLGEPGEEARGRAPGRGLRPAAGSARRGGANSAAGSGSRTNGGFGMMLIADGSGSGAPVLVIRSLTNRTGHVVCRSSVARRSGAPSSATLSTVVAGRSCRRRARAASGGGAATPSRR